MDRASRLSAIVVKRPLAEPFPSIAHTLAVMRYFDRQYGPLHRAHAPRDPTTRRLQSSLFLHLPSDRAVEAIRKIEHDIPVHSAWLSRPARAFRARLTDCFPPDGPDTTPAWQSPNFRVTVERRDPKLHAEFRERTARPPRDIQGYNRGRQQFAPLWNRFKSLQPVD